MTYHARRIIRTAQARWRNLRYPAAVILLYHRVQALAADPWSMAVSPANFAEQMAALKAWNRTETLDAAADRIARREETGCRVVVTFDDGYRDNLTEALPVLEREGIPATLYAVSGALGDPWAFWWDILTRALLETPVLPSRLTLDVGSARGDWDLGDEAECGPQAMRRAALWRADHQAPQGERQRLLPEIWAFLSGLPPDRQRDAAGQLADWAGIGPADAAGPDAPMTDTDLTRLAASPLIAIGGHSATHCDFSRTPDAEAERQIRDDRDRLREITGQPVDHFAYPYGRRGPDTRARLAAAGYRTAVACGVGVATPRHDSFWLPRLSVPDIGRAEFEQLMMKRAGLPRLR